MHSKDPPQSDSDKKFTRVRVASLKGEGKHRSRGDAFPSAPMLSQRRDVLTQQD